MTWIKTQLQYYYILDLVKPLIDEIDDLEAQSKKLADHRRCVLNTVEELEDNIARHKAEYAALINEAQQIKKELISLHYISNNNLLMDRVNSTSYQ